MSHLGATGDRLMDADPAIIARFILLVVPRVRATRPQIVSPVHVSPLER